MGLTSQWCWTALLLLLLLQPSGALGTNPRQLARIRRYPHHKAQQQQQRHQQ
jgi:hypothetical protein